ncbi:dna-directed rna polymerases i ii and iii subunit rpabc2 [Holotrichia oblita]|uniref:Dna-directed rna polymerases i ii and iii subunit rpabc2 n=1 Tax=Holotrichia oblita TaxID=644536 RepID=A0ACB9SK59_HOLOL|nr:dna-directed rna polymerases i ii and iii subunit rpabc2 [Holotrichia oblita]
MTTYKRIFCQEYNFSFFKPRKAQCPLCVRYDGATTEQKGTLQSTYEEHKQREADANNSKMCNKKRASADSSFVTVTFDLQSVLQIPWSDVPPMYYSRKLCGYNLTICEGAPPNNAYCFTWTEVNGARGSLEIGTCLYLYLKALPEHVKEVSLFSDTCGGQNRNQNVLIMIYYFIHHESSNIAVIGQKFLESGHSMMECNSMHSAIEKQKRNLSVYTMNDWINIFKMSRTKRGKKKNDQYKVKELKFPDFIDFKKLSQDILKNRTRNTLGDRVNWLKVKRFRIEKASQSLVKYSYTHSGDYLDINIHGKGRPSKLPLLKKAYSAMLPISEKKYNDLQKLCTNEVIPIEYHAWYSSLPTSTSVRDKKPEPSIDSGSETEED